jgi:hypothetical protein
MEEKALTKTAVFLTTIDNPFNPNTQWDDWLRYDEDHGYYTLSYLARIAKVSDELSNTDYLMAIEQAIDEICELNILGLYTKLIIYE